MTSSTMKAFLLWKLWPLSKVNTMFFSTLLKQCLLTVMLLMLTFLLIDAVSFNYVVA